VTGALRLSSNESTSTNEEVGLVMCDDEGGVGEDMPDGAVRSTPRGSAVGVVTADRRSTSRDECSKLSNEEERVAGSALRVVDAQTAARYDQFVSAVHSGRNAMSQTPRARRCGARFTNRGDLVFFGDRARSDASTRRNVIDARTWTRSPSEQTTARYVHRQHLGGQLPLHLELAEKYMYVPVDEGVL